VYIYKNEHAYLSVGRPDEYSMDLVIDDDDDDDDDDVQVDKYFCKRSSHANSE
jgi:hypothetical protein